MNVLLVLAIVGIGRIGRAVYLLEYWRVDFWRVREAVEVVWKAFKPREQRRHSILTIGAGRCWWSSKLVVVQEMEVDTSVRTKSAFLKLFSSSTSRP